MSDYLVKLYELPDLAPALQRCGDVVIRRPIGPERNTVIRWVRANFGEGWASECEMSFANHPISSFIALRGRTILGFASYDSTVRNFFGPTGVEQSERGKGIGLALLLSCLHAMRDDSYGYAVIGDGIEGFYEKACGAVAIPNSSPGVYRGMI